MNQPCFHCGEPIPKGFSLFVAIDEQEQPMCCVGCHAVATTIVENQLTDYYRYRTENAPKGVELVPEQLKKQALLDEESLQSEFTYHEGDFKEAILTVEGISCAACAWLIEMQINKLKGVVRINVNATTQRATVKWVDSEIKLSEILIAIDKVGYHALPFKASDVEEANQKQSKTFIKRLGVSGILMMQVMMIAVGLYFGAFTYMSDTIHVYLRWTSMLLTLPIVTYGAFPFYTGAFRAIKARRLSMDVPVSIAIILASIASCWATIMQTGEVYFESVSMFTFLLLIGKFLEFRARNRAAEVSANLLKLMPLTATKIGDNDQEEFVVARKLVANDIVIVKPGETIPADGVITQGESPINEAMLSGEQLPVSKTIGDTVFAGTVNGDGNLLVEVKNAGSASFLSQLIRVSEASQAHKPKIAELSDKIAQFFVALILLTSIFTALYWQQHLPHEAFWITLSVLVATCPCALSLATPTALTCGTTRLNRAGIMVKSGHVIETLPEINAFAFDKTGTLTTGDFVIDQVEILEQSLSKESALAYAAALETHSEHPIAKAFASFRDFTVKCSNIVVTPGKGITGNINQQEVKIGSAKWLVAESDLAKFASYPCVMTINGKISALFSLSDHIREDASELLAELKSQNIYTAMLSGDNEAGCTKVQKQLQLDVMHSQLSAEEKMKIIQQMQQNHKVAMVGDGINDAPVFGAAHVSIAMGSGTDIAKNGADVILLNNHLNTISLLRNVAKKTQRIVWQNYGWAFGYNAIVLPLAVCGYITPYMAVIGMSLSSILVITNSLRLLKVKKG
ncbi:heavy metal translocating P-type ATPase [Thalassotalea marina]|uniref:P-type Cu(2+) transporter n=1 Tax=Thalassotalea marina TaxID=1673741 RepID=A0A919EJD8_9GAMM|nr:heavy metal translocating P-type ATPase [Thalassotalea marina]GHF90889.1 copper-translocating P-type ATPase [Thalassotalea marina]